MSSFGVIITTVASLIPIPGADKIEAATIADNDYQFIIRKGSAPVGTTVVYFPLDSILPDALLEKIGMLGKLSGRAKNRVKTIKMKGQISQGLVLLPELVGVTPSEFPDCTLNSPSSEALTTRLGVTKYDDEIHGHGPKVLEKHLRPLPQGLGKYDIESAENYKHIAEQMLDMDVEVSEKVEGQNYSVTAREGSIVVAQRRFSVVEDEGPQLFWEVSRALNILERVEALRVRMGLTALTVYGEMIGPGIQQNYYGIDKHTVKIFEMFNPDTREWLAPTLTVRAFADLYVPVLWVGKLRDWLGTRSIREASNGKSLLAPAKLREGIVIKPLTPVEVPRFGKLILKLRDPVYLAQEA